MKHRHKWSYYFWEAFGEVRRWCPACRQVEMVNLVTYHDDKSIQPELRALFLKLKKREGKK